MVRSKPENYGSLVAVDDDISATMMDNVIVPPDTETGSHFVPLSNIDRNQQKKGMESDFSWLSRRFPVVLMVSVATIFFFFAYAGNMTYQRNDNTIVTDVSKESYEGQVEEIAVEDMTEIIIPYTLSRKGYTQLPYFQPGASTVTTYAFLSNYQSIIEPHVDMLLTVYKSNQEAVMYTYNVCDTTSASCYAGTYTVDSDEQITINVPCKAYDQYTLNVQALDSSSNVILSTTTSAICMYVRREIRELSDDDLSATMDAMHTLWTTTDVEGTYIITHTLSISYHTNTF